MTRLRSALSVAATLAVTAVVACGTNGGNGSGGGAFATDDGGGSTANGGGSGANGGGASNGSSGSYGASSGSAYGNGKEGVASTCIVGSQGCLCDTTGGCASGLTCTPQPAPRPDLCCSGSDCTPAGGAIGATCGSVQGAAMCTPGITVPQSSGNGGTDGCGYPSSSFTESTTLCGITASGGGSTPAIVEVFYSDEHALTLGCATSAYPVSPLSSDPGAATYPETGDPACTDTLGRPLRPVLFVTDLTADPSCTAGDLQMGGHPYDPIAVFGTWKYATEDSSNQGTPLQADPATNGWSLTSSADSVPSSFASCGQMAPPGGPGGPGMPEGGPGGPGGGGNANFYGAELRFEVGLVSGHSYRLQVIVHDGDQNKGGDSGEACAVFCAGTGSAVCPAGLPACTGEGACPSADDVCGEDGCCRPSSWPASSSSGSSSGTASGSSSSAPDASTPVVY